MKSVLIGKKSGDKSIWSFFFCSDSEWTGRWYQEARVALTWSTLGVKSSRDRRRDTPAEWRLKVCVDVFRNILMHTHECPNKCSSARVWRSLPVSMSAYVFGLPSVPQQRLSELFSRSLATLIMSGPPQSINQPSAAPLNPQTGAQGRKCVCVCVWLNYLEGLTYYG